AKCEVRGGPRSIRIPLWVVPGAADIPPPVVGGVRNAFLALEITFVPFFANFFWGIFQHTPCMSLGLRGNSAEFLLQFIWWLKPVLGGVFSDTFCHAEPTRYGTESKLHQPWTATFECLSKVGRNHLGIIKMIGCVEWFCFHLVPLRPVLGPLVAIKK